MKFYRLIHWLGIAAIAAIVVFLGVEILQTARHEVPQAAISKPFKAEDAHFKATFDTELISDAHFLTTVKPDVSEPILPEMGSDAASSFSVEIPVRETDDSWWLDYSSAAESSSRPLAVSGGSSGTTSDLSFSSPVGGSLSGDSSSSGTPSSGSASPSSAAPSSGSTPAAAGGTDNRDAKTSTADTPKRGNGAGAPVQLEKKLFLFAGIRSRLHFRILDFPELRPLFAPDFVWHVNGFRSDEEWERMMRLLRQFNKNVIIGYYHSACTTLPPEKDYAQPSKMPNNQVPKEWILRYANGNPVTWSDTEDRFYLDMRKEEVRRAVINLAIARAKHYGYDAISFDNCYWGYGMPASTGAVVSAEEWTEAFMKFYEEAGKSANENGLKCIVNFAARAGDIPLAFEAISPYVDGIMTEMPFHPNIIKAGKVDRELAAYEKVLKEGKYVFLLQTREEIGLQTMEIARPLLDKYDNIYITIPQVEQYYYHGKDNYNMSKAPSISSWYRRQ